MDTVHKTYRSVKTYGHERGFSCCFRQHKATHSHCSKLHGYALAFELTFEAGTLDDCNWVMDFGGLKRVEAWLKEKFDHTLVIAEDDPKFHILHYLKDHGLARVVYMENVGCEAFAEYVYHNAVRILGLDKDNRVRLIKVKVMEHGSNAAEFEQFEYCTVDVGEALEQLSLGLEDKL